MISLICPISKTLIFFNHVYVYKKIGIFDCKATEISIKFGVERLIDYNNKMKKKPLTSYPSIPAPRVDQFTLPELAVELLKNK